MTAVVRLNQLWCEQRLSTVAKLSITYSSQVPLQPKWSNCSFCANLMGWILTYCSGVCFHWSFGRPCIVRSVSWVGRKIQRRFSVDDGYKAFLDKRTPAADRICIPPTHSKKQFRRSFRFDWIVTSSAKQHTELPIHMTMKTKIASFFLPIFTRIVFYHVMSSYNT